MNSRLLLLVTVVLLFLVDIGTSSIAVAAEKPKARQQEMIARLLRLGMNNTRSDRAEDLNKVVCILRERTGSRVKDLLCGSNSALNYEREISLRGYGSGGGGSYGGGDQGSSSSAMTGRGSAGAASRGSKTTAEDVRIQGAAWVSAFGSIVAANPQGPLVIIQSTSRGRISNQIKEFAEDGSDEENRAILLKYMVMSMLNEADGRHGWPAEKYASFVLAYKKIGELEKLPHASDTEFEAAMLEAITEQDLTIPMYNSLTDEVMGDEDLRLRVLLTLRIEI